VVDVGVGGEDAVEAVEVAGVDGVGVAHDQIAQRHAVTQPLQRRRIHFSSTMSDLPQNARIEENLPASSKVITSITWMCAFPSGMFNRTLKAMAAESPCEARIGAASSRRAPVATAIL